MCRSGPFPLGWQLEACVSRRRRSSWRLNPQCGAPMLVYLLFQRHLIMGLTVGAEK